MSDGTSVLSGKDYIKSIHLRFACLYNRSRCARGRSDKKLLCRHGCEAPEIVSHMIQQCYSTHASRILRHDSLVYYLRRILQYRNYTVHKEPTFTVGSNTLKPDLVVYSSERTVVLDVQIINDQFSLSTSHENKVKKYEVLHDQLANLRPGGLVCSSLT